MRRVLIVGAVLAAVLVAGCSDKPSNGTIRDLIQGTFGELDGKPWVEVERAKKLNGAARGQNGYVADVEYELVFRRDFRDVGAQLALDARGNPFGQMFLLTQMTALKVQYGEFTAGSRLTKRDKIVMIKTEKGWRLEGEGWSGDQRSSFADPFDD